MMHKIIYMAILLFGCEQTSSKRASSPTGEHANYIVDTKRTMSLITGGTAEVTIGNYTPDKTYVVNADYSIKTAFGLKTGLKKLQIEASYWEPVFWTDLRASGVYVSPNYRVTHLGFTDVTLNHVYKNCDLLKITNITYPSEHDLSKLVIVAPVCAEIPAMGAAQVDINGPIDGHQIKVGLDYVSAGQEAF